MIRKKIKNPVINICVVDGDQKAEHLPTVPVHPGCFYKSKINNGKEFTFEMDSKGTKLWVTPAGHRKVTISEGKTSTVQIDNVTYNVSLDSDIVKSDNNMFLEYLLHSTWMHVVLAVLFITCLALVPKQPIIQKTAVKLDIVKIKKLLEKVKQKKLEEKKPVIEPKKIAKPKPKPKKKPKKVVKKRPKPKKIVKKKPKPRKIVKKKPKKVVIAKKPVKKKAIRKGPTKAQLAAKAREVKRLAKIKIQKAQKAKLAKSLNFLSTSKGDFSMKTKSYIKSGKNKFKNTVVVPNSNKKANTLNRLAVASSAAPISTTGARAISSAEIVSGANVGSTAVEGKVSKSAVSGKSNMSAAMSKNGSLSMSGEGSLKSSLIEKILAKNIDKLRYCYEKALLSDSSLGGNIMMKWTIRTTGNVSRVKVVRSQLQNGKLHGCISRQLSAIRFPKPSGGSVVVKFPFSFTSTSI